ncbi:nucleotidyltransferase domain-containing protein [Crocosphaera sp.]|uniref:type VII toxin-antitoxin system MntA family adenylyltransferase antitoxin n=1 Tax=Crocosphaera sp. TaxID=2729996 RepID=UPI00262C3DF3|nr:nucleotidyltransferase domain-containing protein [Crocosphaera sp.]MDJ0579482.1 nucleotidyltransferase domain-containing protein [Crocosphaera sp.]
MSIFNVNQLHNFSDKLVQKIPHLKILILFGSRARGDHDSHSDWDFAILYDETKNQTMTGFNLLEIYSILADIFNIPDDKIDLVNLEYCSPLIAHYVSRDGQLLYEQETGLFENFKNKHLLNQQQLSTIQTSLREKLENFLQRKGL